MPARRAVSNRPASRAIPILALAAVLAFAERSPGHTAPRPVDGELLIQFRDGLPAAAEATARAELGHRLKRRFAGIRWQQIALPSGMSVENAITRYRRHPAIAQAEPNWLVQVQAPRPDSPTATLAAAADTASPEPGPGIPDDPMFAGQWALRTIRAPDAWLRTTGATEVVVAVIDTGVNYRHEDLAPNIWTNAGEIPGNGIDDDANGWVDDLHGIDTANDPSGNDSDPMDRGYSGGIYHGTMVAGIVGAVGRNTRGIAGINWSVRLLPIRAIRASGDITTADELEGLSYLLVMKQRGVPLRVVNLSYGGMPYSTAQRDALAALDAAGVLLCAAAGNSGANTDSIPNYPSGHALPGIIAVAASDELDRLATFPLGGSSSFGRTTVDLAAPGVRIRTTSGPTTNAYEPEFSGTSPATPHVTGAVALLAALRPDLPPQTLKAAILESVDRPASLTNLVSSHGRLNLRRALDHPAIAQGPPVVARPASATNVLLGGRFTLETLAYGGRPRTAQWLLNHQPLPGATNETFSRANATAGDAGLYTLTLSNAWGVTTSPPAPVEIWIAPSITTPPVSQSVPPGRPVTLSVAFSGTPARFGVQWLQGTTPRASNHVAGSVAFFTLTNFQSAQTGTWRVRVRNPATPAGNTGAERTFTLKLDPDADLDGLPDQWELAHGLQPANPADARLDPDGDSLDTLSEFSAGTNPTNSLSRLELQCIASSGQQVALQFFAASNRTYQIRSAPTPESFIWSSLASFPAHATNRVIRWTNQVANESLPDGRFFRLTTPASP